ncbi:MAG TPA: hypothetical protein PL041_12775 [Melioribacteraceae bacterium]|nr:hypothetical protein [Melioribacteraceae bacterium]
MINWIRLNIGRYFLHKKLKVNEKLTFNKFFSNSYDLFIIMPENDDNFKQAIKVVEFLKESKKNITLFLIDYQYNLFADNKLYELIYYQKDDKNWFNLPKLSILQKVNEHNYDIAINLSLDDTVFTPLIINKVKSKFRIGFKNSYSDLYYNFIVEPDKINSEISYKNLLNSLKLF